MYAKDFLQVGSNIQERIKEKGMTQQCLADKLGISKQVMNKIIKGSKAINVNELVRIAEILEISADRLLTVKTEPAASYSFSFMGETLDERTINEINLIGKAIDEIHMLEELLDD